MAYKIEFEEKALADFETLDGSVKRQIQKYIVSEFFINKGEPL